MQIISRPFSGIYPVSFFRGNVFAAFSGRQYDRSRFNDFLTKASFFPKALVRPKQVHGDEIMIIDCIQRPEPVRDADGLLTNIPGPVLGILTADCIPAFFWDPVQKATGLAHAGWRGLKAGILSKMILKMQKSFGSRPGDVQVVFGPAIRSCCYEVGRDFQEYFPGFYLPFSRDKGKMDLPGFARQEIIKGGIPSQNIFDTEICTSCQKDSFFSARRGDLDERILSVIQIR